MMMWSKRLGGVLLSLVLWSANPVAAQLAQPDGTVIPQSNNLLNALNGETETIVPLTDAAVTPETFNPKCELTFKVIARGAGFRNSFGWYNVVPGRTTPPPISELYEFITCSDGVGTERTLDLRNDVRYLGGEIGFYQATPEGKNNTASFCFSNCGPNCPTVSNPSGTIGYLFYSEARFNPDSGSSPTIHLLIMDSRVYPNAFYFGWEDKYEDNDHDFEDLLMRVEGVQCSGGGAACETGLLGVCADGVTQCRNGDLQCVGSREASNETCNALDDDCDGNSDEGDGLCGSGQVCESGTCIGACGLDSFCPNGLMCAESGRCVDPACANTICDAGMICVAGTCRAACEGVTCPFGQHCRSGQCVGQCLNGCEAGQVCDQGVCISCDCDRCGGDRVCAEEQGMCVEPACASLTCADGTHCEAGVCVDDCQGVVCPRGFACSAGDCVVQVEGGSGGTGGAGGIGGFGGSAGSGGVGGVSGVGGSSGASGASGASGVGGVSGTGGTAATGGVSGASGMSAGAGGTSGTYKPDGCACDAVGNSGTQSSNVAWVLLGAVAFAMRRRVRRA